MNTDPTAKRVLCYGDSLTYGRVPGKNERFSAGVRWTGVLQNGLGSGYEIIEEGLCARTTDIDDPDGPGLNGYTYFQSAVTSHLPFQLLVLMLGTNDLKDKFHRSAKEVAASVSKYIDALKAVCVEYESMTPKVLIVSPPLLDETFLRDQTQFAQAAPKALEMAQEYQRISIAREVHFLDAAAIVGKGRYDGVHLDEQQNRELGEALTTIVKNILK